MTNWIERLDIQPLTAQDVGQIILHSVLAILLAFLFCIVVGSLSSRAYAHDALGQSDWIGESHVKSVGINPVLCCGKDDCPRIPEHDVRDEPDGVHVHVKMLTEEWDEIIPYSEVQPSADGYTYRCAWPGPKNRKCFFRKQPGS